MKVLYIDNVIKRNTNPIYTQIMMEMGFDVGIAANLSEIESKLKHSKITYHHIDLERNTFSLKNLTAYRQLLDIIHYEGYDVIHCKSPTGGVLGRLCGRRMRVRKVIYSAHGFHFYKGASIVNSTILKWAEMLLAHYTDAIITINKEDYSAAQRFKLRNNGKVYYISGIGVDTTAIGRAVSKRRELQSQFGIEDKDLILISIGELNRNKNNKIIIEAIIRLANRNIHYFVCGIGDEKKELIDMIERHHIENNVHFLGYRTDIPQLLKSSDIFVMPSFREGLPRAMMEAMAAGLPCISSRIRGNVDLIENDKGGYLCDPNDVDCFAESIEMLANDIDKRRTMSLTNLDVIKKFDRENIEILIKNIYQEVLEVNSRNE